MNAIDLIIVVFVGIGLLRGLFTGAVRQILSIVGLVAAVLLALQFSTHVGSVITGFFAISEEYATPVGFVVVFIVVQTVALLLARLVEGVFKVLKLSFLDRAAGGIVGGLKAVLVLSAIFFVLNFADYPEAPMRQESVLYSPVSTVLPTAWELISNEVLHKTGGEEPVVSEP